MASAFSTRLIHSGTVTGVHGSALTVPIFETTTFVVESAEDLRRYHEDPRGRFLYSRYENPTVVAVEDALATADDAEAALAFGSGMAATCTLLLTVLASGDEVVCSAAVYGGTFRLLTDFLPKFGIHTRFATLDELREPERLLGDRTKLVWFESPINPTLRCVDIGAIADACRARGVLSAIDNTFASPVNQQPLARGIDLSMQSATKYLSGHSDVTGGVLSGSAHLIEKLAAARRQLGGVMDPHAAHGLLRGLKTLPLRVARHNSNALAVATALEGHPRVRQVLYPGLASHPDHALAGRQMSGFGGMVCLDLDGGSDAACRAFDRLRIVKRAASLGGTESLCSLPVLTSHWGYSDAELDRAGVTDSMMRLSIGLEDPADLVADLSQALDGS